MNTVKKSIITVTLEWNEAANLVNEIANVKRLLPDTHLPELHDLMCDLEGLL